MGNAYGFIEIQGVVPAMTALDIMCKTADVELATWERKLGGRLVTLVVQGDVSAVTQAVETAAKKRYKEAGGTGRDRKPASGDCSAGEKIGKQIQGCGSTGKHVIRRKCKLSVIDEKRVKTLPKQNEGGNSLWHRKH